MDIIGNEMKETNLTSWLSVNAISEAWRARWHKTHLI